MTYKLENVYVNRLDLDLLKKDIQEVIGKPIKIQAFDGLIMKPKPALINTEIVCKPVREDGFVILNLYKADTTVVIDGKTMVRMDVLPYAVIAVNISAIQDYVIESMTLSEYVKERRGYNNRLIQNESELIKWLNR